MKNMKLNSILAGLLFATLAAPTLSHAESLANTLHSALENSSLRAKAGTQVQISEAQTAETRALQRGTVTATAGVGLNNFNGYSPLMPRELYKPMSVGLNFALPLYTSGRLQSLLKASELGQDVAAQNRRGVEQQVLLNAGAAYLELAKAKDIEALNLKQRDLLNQELKLAQAELKAGLRTITDVSQARARLAGVQATVEQATASVKAAEANYVQVVGREAEGLFIVPELAFEEPQMPYVQEVLNTSPALAAGKARTTQARANYSAVKAEDGVSVQLTGTLSTDRENNPMLVRESSQSIGIQISMPIFEGGKSNARRSAAALSVRAQEQDVEEIGKELRAQAVSAWESYTGIKAQEYALAEQAESAELALTGVKAEYKIGTRTLLDVLNAEQEVLQTQTAILENRYRKAETVLRLNALRGSLQG